jgi:hypothetical protein
LHDLICGARVNVLEIPDGIVVKTGFEVIKKYRATPFPLQLACLDGIALLRILPKAIGDLIALAFLKCYLANAPADVAIETTYTMLYFIGWDNTLLHCQFNAPPAPDSRLVAKTILIKTITTNL